MTTGVARESSLGGVGRYIGGVVTGLASVPFKLVGEAAGLVLDFLGSAAQIPGALANGLNLPRLTTIAALGVAGTACLAYMNVPFFNQAGSVFASALANIGITGLTGGATLLVPAILAAAVALTVVVGTALSENTGSLLNRISDALPRGTAPAR